METKAIVATIGAGLIGGYVGTKMMESVSMKLYEWESEDDRQQEDTVRPGPPFRIAAEKTIGLLGVEPSEEQLHKVSMLFHYGAGLSWGPVYTFLRHRPGLPPVWAALLTGTSMSAILDEGLTLMLGFSASNRAYPLVTHVRGVIAHLVYGLRGYCRIVAVDRTGTPEEAIAPNCSVGGLNPVTWFAEPVNAPRCFHGCRKLHRSATSCHN